MYKKFKSAGHFCDHPQLNFVLQMESLSLTFHGHDLIVDSELELNYGRLR